MLVRRVRPAMAWLGRAASRCFQAALDLVYPPACALCGDDLPTSIDTIPLCADCLVLFAPPDLPACRRCGAFVTAGQCFDAACYYCRGHRLRFARAIALGNFAGKLAGIVRTMKEVRGESLVRAVGDLLADRLKAEVEPSTIDLVVPIPSHWARRFKRGRANAAATLARRVAFRLSLPLAGELLYARRNAVRQHLLEPPKRRKNMRGVFAAAKGYDIKGAHALVVDDVLTTGATANEATRVLDELGAARVTVLVVARGLGIA